MVLPIAQPQGGQPVRADLRDLEGDEVSLLLRALYFILTDSRLPPRLNTILNSDRVLVLQAGRVVELASPSALRSQPHSVFQQLLQSSQLGAHTLPPGC